MGSRWSTPTTSSSSPGGTQQAISPGVVPRLFRGKNLVPARYTAGLSPSSTSATRAAALSRARLKRRRRRIRKKGIDNVSRVVTVHGMGAAADKTAAAEVARQIVGERILLYWPRIAAWVDCEVLEFGEQAGSTCGQHRVRYTDGLCEWTELKRYRLVIAAKLFARAVRGRTKAPGGGEAAVDSDS